MSTLLATLLICIRITAMLLAAPILGHRSVPIFIKLILAVVITLAATPLLLEQLASNDVVIGQADFASAIVSEATIGSLIGFGVMVIFSAAQMIGVAIGQMSGLQLDAATESNESLGQLPVERLIAMVAIAMFVLFGGPELMMGALLESFTALPIGSALQHQNVLDLIVGLLGQSFELTVLAIAPAVASLLISTIVVGMLMRTLPQLNLIQLGLSSNVSMMLLTLILTLGGSVWMMLDELQPTIAKITDRLQSIEMLNPVK